MYFFIFLALRQDTIGADEKTLLTSLSLYKNNLKFLNLRFLSSSLSDDMLQ